MFNFKISCDQATTICDKSQYGKATLRELLLLRMHFFSCKICRLYSKQNGLMSRIFETMRAEQTVCAMSKEQKEGMRAAIEKNARKKDSK